jgi:hypothetical protein
MSRNESERAIRRVALERWFDSRLRPKLERALDAGFVEQGQVELLVHRLTPLIRGRMSR